jgi:hypothetical protein
LHLQDKSHEKELKEIPKNHSLDNKQINKNEFSNPKNSK